MNDKKVKVYLLITIFSILVLIGYGIYLLIDNDDVILDSSKEIIYTAYENKDYNQQIPYVNIKKVSNQINNSIDEYIVNYKDKQAINISYHYQINGNVLSLMIIVEDYSFEGAPNVSFKSYNINLKKLRVLTDDEVLKLFDLTKVEVSNSIENRFKKYYEDEITKGIITNMSYEEYMTKRELSNLKDDIYLYIKDSKLNVYLDYNSFLSEEKIYYLADVGYIFEFE
ncbi:MAG: hypothetical protein IKE63_04690 [Bacilli bacterium]|nr:hypothetical protein [Bacilli bacterium]